MNEIEKRIEGQTHIFYTEGNPDNIGDAVFYMKIDDVRQLIQEVLIEQRKQDYESFCIKEYKHVEDSVLITELKEKV
jgi:siroheme synthase